MYQLKSLHATLAEEVKKITKLPDGRFDLTVDADAPHWPTPGTVRQTNKYHHVIRCTGWKYVVPELFDPGIKPDVDEQIKYPVLSSCWESSIRDVFYIGTAMAARDRKSASGFIHGFRYNVRTLFHLLEQRYNNVRLPSCQLELRELDDLTALAELLISRVSLTSALYQLYGFLCDVLVLSPERVELF
jgi:hypothetical protein